MTSSLTDCQINTDAIRILWAICLAESVLLFVFTLRYYISLYRKHLRIQAEARSRGTKYTLFQNKGLLAVTPYIYVSFPAHTAFAIMKIVNPDATIGSSWLATILWIVFRLAYYLSGYIMQPNLLDSILKSQKNLAGVLRSNWIAAGTHLFFATTAAITAIPVNALGIANPFFPVEGLISVAVYLLVHSLTFGFQSLQCKYLEITVNKILDQSYLLTKDERTKRIRDKLTNVQNAFFKITFFQFFIYFIFGVLVFTWRYHQYLLVFSWFLPPITLIQVVRSIHHEDSPRSSSKKNSIQDKSSPNMNNQRKMIVNVNNLENAASAETNDEGKPMHVYGLELDPKPDSTLKQESTLTEDYVSVVTDKEAIAPLQTQNPLKQRPSPAMKLLRALTPSRKKNQGESFNFDESAEKLKEEDGNE